MCLQKAPELVACMSAHLASRWPRIQVEPGAFGFPWYCDGDPLLSENFNDLTKDIGETILKAAKYVDSPVLNRVLPTVRRPPTTISLSMDNRWFFSKQDIIDSPNMRLFADPDQEVIFKLRVTTLVQEMGEKLKISTHTICIAMIYVHRFFMHFTFQDVDATKIAMVAFHLAGKTRNEPRKLEYFLKTAYSVVSPDDIQIDVKSEDWDRKKGRCKPEEKNYFAAAKTRFRAAMREHPNIRRLEINESHSKDFKFKTEAKMKKFLQQFLIDALVSGKYKDKIFWTDRNEGIFRVSWSHKNSKEWSEDYFQLFMDWDKKKGRCKPEEINYFAAAKTRFRAALRYHPNIKRFEIKESPSRDYQFINTAGINTEDKENERPSSATPSPEEIEENERPSSATPSPEENERPSSVIPSLEEIEEKELYTNLEEEITGLESVMPPVLGFQLNVELPHPHVIRLKGMINGNHELTKKALFLCTASMIATTMCLQYEPGLVVCVNLASRWSNIQIEPRSIGLPWYCYVNPLLSEENFNDLTDELGETILKAAKYVDSSVLRRVLSSVRRLQTTRPSVAENFKETNAGEISEKASEVESSEKEGAAEISNYVAKLFQEPAVTSRLTHPCLQDAVTMLIITT